MNRTSEVRGHMGEMLFVVAGTYPDLLGFILEVVQNAIDANPKFISVDVDMETRTVVVQDDGSGVTQNTFERALQQIGITIKKKDRLGRFGRGVISPLGKCKSFTFTSCPRRGATKRGYLEWTFVSDDIREHPENVRIPMRKRKDLGFSSKPKIARGTTYVQWRTQVAVQDITKDSFVSRINMGTLADSILDKFGTVMRRHKIAVHVTYTTESGKSESRDLASKEYEGKALPKEVISHPDSGDTVFNLFLARVTKKGRRGKVRFGEMGDDFRLTMHQVSNSVRGVVGDDVLKALGSGIFEGDILSENVRLHPGRRSFEKNDALLGFLESLETWYKQVGS
ncbi:MAG: ATP-binding protein, partial [Planctomycetota bacterium]|nr:ATP-binding protein [Planctomycetota bacterium]